MSIAGITFKTKTASEHEVLGHLSACNDSYVPPLSRKTDLISYSKKIVEKAITFEAWNENELAGLIAAYFNDGEKHAGYITNVSVLPEFSGKGIGSELLSRCIDHAIKGNYREIRLEVNKANTKAISLYRKNDFVQTGENGDDVVMTWKNNGRK